MKPSLRIPVTTEREQRETVAVEVVPEQECRRQLAALTDARAALLANAVAREPTTRVRVLVPCAIGALRTCEMVSCAPRRERICPARRDEREQRPRGLRRRARATAARRALDVRFAAFSEASVAVLARREPEHGTPHRA